LSRDVVWLAQASLASRRARRSRARVGVAVVYHRIGVDGGDAKREILAAVAARSFARLLHYFRRHYRVVSAGDLLDAVRRRERGEPFPLAITFDDDLASHVTEALPALREAGVTATFFVSGTPRRFWWQDLQEAVDGQLVDSLPHVADADLRAAVAREEKAIFRVAAAIEALPREQRDETAAALRAATVTPPDDGLDADGIRTLVDAGFEVGFHTLRHEALPALEDGDLTAALRDGRDELADLTGMRVDAISYPHGKGDERVADAARAAGYAFGFTTSRTTVTADTDPLLLPRIPPALSAGKTALRVAQAVATSVSDD